MGNVSYQGVKVVDDDTGVAEITAANHLQTINMGQLIPEVFDYIVITYVPGGTNGAGEIQTVTYKDGGASGTVVAALMLIYNADNQLDNITRY